MRTFSSYRPATLLTSSFTGQASASTSISGTVTAMRASPTSDRSSAGLAAGSAGRTATDGAWLGAMLPGRQSRALRQGIDSSALIGPARALHRRHDLSREPAGKHKTGYPHTT